MKNSRPLRVVIILGWMSSVFELVGCAAPALPVKAASLEATPASARIPAKVLLVLAPETCTYSHQDKIGPPVQMGEAICKYAESSARDVFRTVFVQKSNVQSPEAHDVRIILSPKVIASNVALPMWAWNDMSSVVIVEWIATDPTGRPIWTKTFRGEASGSPGSNFGMGQKRSELLNQALHQSMSASRDSWLSTDGVRDLASPVR